MCCTWQSLLIVWKWLWGFTLCSINVDDVMFFILKENKKHHIININWTQKNSLWAILILDTAIQQLIMILCRLYMGWLCAARTFGGAEHICVNTWKKTNKKRHHTTHIFFKSTHMQILWTEHATHQWSLVVNVLNCRGICSCWDTCDNSTTLTKINNTISQISFRNSSSCLCLLFSGLLSK